jgi:AraC family transcriptional regulator, regulatory protein of adaptative response / methylphosphotriester-DNA alkyltransferase methyltransferase
MASLIITRARVDGDILLAPHGVVDLSTIPRLQLALAEGTRSGKALTVDLTGVEVRGAAGLALLLNAVRRAHTTRGQLRVACPPGPFRSALQRTGLARRIDLIANLDPQWRPQPERRPPRAYAAAAHRAGRRRMRATPERRSALLAQATIALEAHYAEPELSLDQIARRIATSRRQLQRVFAEVAGTTFRAELNAVRMQHAAELLATSELPVGVIAGRVGHRQPAQFSSAFRRHHGMPPTAFRRAAAAQAPDSRIAGP